MKDQVNNLDDMISILNKERRLPKEEKKAHRKVPPKQARRKLTKSEIQPQKRDQKMEQLQQVDIFKGGKYTFIPYDLDLTVKRIQILEGNMKKKGAIIIPFKEFTWDTERQGSAIILTSKKMPLQTLKGIVHPAFQQNIPKFTFIDCDWVSLCLQENQWIDPGSFKIDMDTRTQNSQTKEGKPDETKKVGATFLRQQTLEGNSSAQAKEEQSTKKEENVGMNQKRNLGSVITIDDDGEEIELQTSKKPRIDERVILGEKRNDNLPDINEKTWEKVASLKEKENEDQSAQIKKSDGDKDDILVCQVGNHKNLNSQLTKPLEKMLQILKIERDKGRVYGYGHAIAILKTLPFSVKTVDDISNVSGLGKSTKRLIGEILETGTLRALEEAMKEERIQTTLLFTQIYGVGPITALHWYSKGLKNIEDLRKNPELLNHEQEIGVKYFEEFQEKIPRKCSEEILELVKRKADGISDYPGQYEVICGGSYRRGRDFSGDVDIIAAPRDDTSSKGFCMKLVKSLEGTFLTDHLSMPGVEKSDGDTYLGVCYHNGIHRRIDFKICDRERFGALMIYYTGGDYFNRSIRTTAEKKDYKLDNFGVYKLIRVGNTKHLTQLVPCYNEQDVFRLLGLRFVPPEFRDI